VANSEAHDENQIETIISTLPDPYVPPAGGLWVAWKDEVPVGCAALQAISPDVGEVKRMYVREESRGKGVARALAHRVIDEARARGYSTLRLGTLEAMIPARTLYESLGFVSVPPYRPAEFGPTVFYELKLK
jgi:GNAT superfamily N-acetyltransferase